MKEVSKNENNPGKLERVDLPDVNMILAAVPNVNFRLFTNIFLNLMADF